MASLNEFKREYLKAINEGTVGVFAGAGLSQASGFVNWKQLLEPFARDINLDVTKEYDLVSLAQYYLNYKRNRGNFNQLILNSFLANTEFNDSLKALCRLPIETYWTTNYDHLIEQALNADGKKVDVKITAESLANNLEKRDAVVYKMHGDAQMPETCILTKDDYESYSITRKLFVTALQGDLVTKTFLFIGFSFEDPNLNYILARIRVLINENVRNHYWFVQKIKKREHEKQKDYEYRKVKQQHYISDLKRYGIQAVELESYDDIPGIINELRNLSCRHNVFISGSAKDYGDFGEYQSIQLIRILTKKLNENFYTIFTGHGRGVGSYIISTAFEYCLQKNIRDISKVIQINSFPYEDNKREDYNELKTQYRESIAAKTGVSIFIFGNKDIDGEVACSPGVWEEYIIAKKHNHIIIPIGSTGFQAQKIYEAEINELTNKLLIKYYKTLSSEKNPVLITEAVMDIIKHHITV